MTTLVPLALLTRTAGFRLAWGVAAAITVLAEVLPSPHMTPFVHYGLYGPAKLLCFFVLGLLTPLAFRRMNGEITFALLSAALIEGLQTLIGNGHHFHIYELIAKWTVIVIGFTYGLDAFIRGTVRLGRFRITLAHRGPDDVVHIGSMPE